MMDPVSTTIDALARHDLSRLAIVVFAGFVTSIGPCVAPRYVALAAVLDGTRRRGVTIAAFIAGMLLAYGALGFGVGILGTVWRHVDVVYALLAIALLAGGAVTLLRQTEACAPGAHEPNRPACRLSGVFSLGAASVLIVSPCCTPIVAAIAEMTAFNRAPATSAVFLGAFAFGHAAPLWLAGLIDGAVAGRLRRFAVGGAPAIVSGTLMIALGIYYGVLL